MLLDVVTDFLAAGKSSHVDPCTRARPWAHRATVYSYWLAFVLIRLAWYPAVIVRSLQQGLASPRSLEVWLGCTVVWGLFSIVYHVTWIWSDLPRQLRVASQESLEAVAEARAKRLAEERAAERAAAKAAAAATKAKATGAAA